MNFTTDEIYGCSFDEFCKKTYTTPELFIKAIEAEIEMLEKRYEELTQAYRALPYEDEESDRIVMLLREVNSRLERKRRKLEKYKRIACEKVQLEAR